MQASYATSNVAPLQIAVEDPKPPAPPKAKRIDAFDSMRFFLIFYIVVGHFITFAIPKSMGKETGGLIIAFSTQINVVVGAFFALSGYVAAYTMTEMGQKKVKDKVASTPAPVQTLGKIFGYWPLHFVVLLIFCPMFIYSDLQYNAPYVALTNAIMSVTMTQAWFPLQAEIWNAPTWFLGALTFATVLQPYYMPVVARQDKKQLRRTWFWLFLFGFIPRLAYCYDLNAWGFLEGAMPPKDVPNRWAWNNMRFNPCYAAMEVMIGAVACRLVMMDGAEGEDMPKVSFMNTVFPLTCIIVVLCARALRILALSDMLTRSCIFMPLFLMLMMGLHRASLRERVTDPLAIFLAWPRLTWLGGQSFPIFVVHGPLGQVFYKKVVARKLFGGPCNEVYGAEFFGAYLLTVLAAAWLLNTFFMKSKVVAQWSKNAQSALLPYC